ncbi:hypothetical protein BmR1_04g06310 [Babesia microti strain RI]|uniref:Tubulin-specific chaperone A n=1 Tax=Babesia microti (strain RI) TaxID=1133968 RepID=I7I9Q7_BABMR|nr:hypothetical protein BmR1_04g06310 [Babesia microti strain RI]CCF75459.1 hypothetical protein BmR1_04g06310 [Babesia microti strain RI]|eukprot:XP_012649867.1 hypothetical protein BmR1_04g06310 [Babesia microti strain RI]
MVAPGCSTDPVVIELGRKHCSVARTSKEYESYKTELLNRQSHLDHLKASGGDEHDIKRSNEFLEETQMVLANRKEILIKYINELKSAIINTNPESVAIESRESINNAIKAANDTLSMLKEDCPELFE